MDEQKIVANDATLIEVADTIVSKDAVSAVNAADAADIGESGVAAKPFKPVNAIGTVGVGFEILSVLGEGAMGTVYKARHLLLDKVVAIKVLKDEFTSQSKVFMRFQNEARTTSHLSHENIASVHDFGLTESGHPYIVMDFVEGQTLADLIEKNGAVPEAEAIAIFKQIGHALCHAHEKGVVHRDLKPSNIILTKKTSGEWLVKVVDFGIAKVMLPDGDTSSPKLTQTGEVFGTPLYMSPEQCQGAVVDRRSDIYSFACLMYETLMGVRPFAGENTFALLLAHVNHAPLPFREKNKNVRVSDALERIVFRAMEKAPEDRYQSVESLLADLESVNKGGAVAPSKQYSKPRQKRFGKILLTVLSVPLGLLLIVASFLLIFFGSNYLKSITLPWARDVSEGVRLRSLDLMASEASLRRALAIAEKSHATPQQMADIQYELGTLLHMRAGPTHEVYMLFSQVAKNETQDNLKHTNSLDYLGRAELAESERIRAQAESARIKGAGAAEIAQLKADVQRLRKQAIQHATEAVDLKARLINANEEGYLENALRSRGLVYYGEGMYAEAEQDYLKALAIAVKLNMADEEAVRYLDLARCYVGLGKDAAARQNFDRALAKMKQVYGPESEQAQVVAEEYDKYLHGGR